MIELTNSPPPSVHESDVRELLKIGGLNRFGKPNLILEWGQSTTQWFRGKWRIKYREMSIPAQKRIKYTRTKDSQTRVYATLGEAIADEWGIFELKVSYEFIGKALWYVSRWHPPEEKGTPEEWEQTRYKAVHDVELGYMPKCDMLGEYPSEGFYEPMIVAGEYRGENTPSGAAILHYRPIDDDVLEDVRKAWQERQQAKPFDATQFIRDWYTKDEEDTKKETDEEHYRRMDIAKTAYHIEAKDRVFNKE